MNGHHDAEPRTAARLTNLLYTDPLPHLPLPQVPQPLSAAALSLPTSLQLSFAQDGSFLDRAASLLQSVDLSYIEARGPLPAAAEPCGPLHQALLARHSAALSASIHHAGPTLPPLQKRHLTLAASPPQGVHEAPTSPLPADAAPDAQAGPSYGNHVHANESASVPTKRKRSVRKPARSVPVIFSSTDEAGAFHAAVAAFLERAAAPDAEGGGSQHGAQHAAKELRSLADAVGRARAADVVPQADPKLLRRLLSALVATMKAAEHASLPPDGDDGSVAAAAILATIDAAVAVLNVASAPGVPRQAVPEEALEQACGLLRHHLLHNVLAFHDSRLQRLHRPALVDADAVGEKAGSARKRQKGGPKAASTGISNVPEAVRVLQGRLGAALEMLAQLLSGGGVSPTALIPLLRAAAAALTVSHLNLLHVQAASLLVAAFQHMPQHRGAIMDELVGSVLPHAYTAKAVPRATAAVPDSQPPIHIVTSLVLQMLQASVALPAMDTAPDAMRNCFSPAIIWADSFWSAQLDRMSSTAGAKTEADAQVKLWVERIIADLLAVLNCPEWPAASLLLTRGLRILNGNGGLGSSNQGVRQMAVDLLGSIVAALSADKDANDAPELAGLVAQAAETDEHGAPVHEQHALQAVQTMLLQHLSLSAQAGDTAAAVAVAFTVCRMFFEEVCGLQKANAGETELREALVAHRRLFDGLADDPAVDLSFGEAVRLERALVQDSSLGRGRSHILKWLLNCIDASQQGATVRCKAVKALKAAVQVSGPILKLEDVQEGVSRALQDEAVSVREAAVDLLGRHIGDSVELAEAYLDDLIQASRDTGTSVRKRALTILWESCIRLPNFPRAMETCVAVLQRSADPEESVRDLVAKVFQSLWFSPGAQKTAAQRAAQLAEVAAEVYDRGGSGIRLPLEAEHPLVTVMTAAVRKEQGGTSKKSIGAQCGQQLLEAVLAAHDAAVEAPILQAFPPLLALHALGLAEPKLCMPAKDPTQFVRALAPYLKDEAGSDPSLTKLQAESLMCIMCLVSALLPALEHLDKSVCDDLEKALVGLIQRHLYPQVVQAACRTLAELARLSPKAGASLARLTAYYVDRLAGRVATDGSGLDTSQAPPGSVLAVLLDRNSPPAQLNAARGTAVRTLIVLGHLARFGADILEAAAADEVAPDGKMLPTLEQLMDLLVIFHGLPTGGDKVADAALQSLGALFIARPGFMLLKAPKAVMHAALQPTAPPLLKNRALLNITELLKAEEARLVEQQALAAVRDAIDGALPAADPRAQPDANAAALAVQNGEGESLGVSSGILQGNWDLVLALATDTAPGGAATAEAAQAQAAQVGLVRRRVRDLIEAVLRGGLTAPWSAVPALVALATDPQRDVGDGALRLLRQLVEKLPNVAGILHTRLPEGIALAHSFHLQLAAATGPAATPASPSKRLKHGLAPELASGVAALYTQLVQQGKGTRSGFLMALLRRFDSAACLVTRSAAPDLTLLSTCAQLVAILPFRRADEPLSALVAINAIIAKRGDAVLAAFKAALTHMAEPPPAEGGGTPAATVAAAGSPMEVDVGDANGSGGRKGTVAAAQADGSMAGSSAAGGSAAAGDGEADVAADLAAACNASLAVSMLLQLKAFLLAAYGLVPERVAMFANASADKKKQEEKVVVSCDRKVPHGVGRLRLDAAQDPARAAKQYLLFKGLLRQDTADYLGSLQPTREGAADDGTPATNGAGDNKGVGGGSTAGGTKGRRRAASTLSRQRSSRLKRQRQAEDSEDDDDGDYQPEGGSAHRAAGSTRGTPAPRRQLAL